MPTGDDGGARWLLSGDPGIGKTTVLIRLARARPNS